MTNGARGGELVGSGDVKYCDFHLIASWNCQLSISVHYSKYIVHIIGQIDFLSQNIAKGTTDPRVEFISQDRSSQILSILQFQNLD